MRRAFLAGAAVVALVCAGLLGLLASDVRQWEQQLAHDDLAFREAPEEPGLFEGDGEVLGGSARRLLGLDDDLAFRRALQLLWLSVAAPPAAQDPEPGAARDAAEIALAEIAGSDSDRRRRSQVTNLLGVLSVAPNGQAPGDVRGNRLESAIVSFRTAVLLDDRNDRAKYNLELALRSSEDEAEVNLPRGAGGEGALGRTGSGF
jgi:hypothetical protein